MRQKASLGYIEVRPDHIILHLHPLVALLEVSPGSIQVIAISYRCVATPTSATLYSIQDSANPVLEQVWDIPNRVAVREEVPALGTISAVIEP